MKKRLLILITTFVVTVALISSVFCVSATESAVSIDFESDSHNFVPPGDLDGDGMVAAEDLASFCQLLLQKVNTESYADLYAEYGEEVKYADANGDGYVDLRDFVRTKKNVVQDFIGSTIGLNGSAGMNVLGKTSYSKSLKTILEADSYYKLSYSYKAEKPITVVIDSIGNDDYVFESKASNQWVTKTHLFATAEEYNSDNGIELWINGIGVIDNITITPCTIDNDLSDLW